MPSAPTVPATLSSHLRRLGLLRAAADLNDLIARATKDRWTPVTLLETLAGAELEDRAHRSLERRFKRARLGRFKRAPTSTGHGPRLSTARSSSASSASTSSPPRRISCWSGRRASVRR